MVHTPPNVQLDREAKNVIVSQVCSFQRPQCTTSYIYHSWKRAFPIFYNSGVLGQRMLWWI